MEVNHIEKSPPSERCYNFRKRSCPKKFAEDVFDEDKNLSEVEEYLNDGVNYESSDNSEDGSDNCSDDMENPPSKKQKNFEVSPEVSQIIKSPDYEIQPTFRGRKCLIIFDSANRDMCYKFYLESRTGSYFCFGCRENHWKTEAKLFSDETESEKPYVLLKNEHRCESIPYVKKREIILEESEFKTCLLPTGKQRIFIFDKEKEKLGYEFAWRKNNFYVCLGCLVAEVKYIFIRLCQHENGKNYIRATNEKHLCKLRDFNPEKYEDNFVYSPNFKFYRKNPVSLYLIIFPTTYHEKCRTYVFSPKDNNIFWCKPCYKEHKKWLTVKLLQDSNGKEYIRLNKSEHICNEITNYEDLLKSSREKIEFFNESGLFSENNDSNKSKIIEANNFRLIEKKDGISVKKLIVFADGNKSKSFIYNYNSQVYVCLKCRRKKRYVYAKIHFNDDGEKCIKLGKIDHVCKPIATERNFLNDDGEIEKSKEDENEQTEIAVVVASIEEKIIYPPNYRIYRLPDKNSRAMIVYSSEDLTMGYNNHYYEKRKIFECKECIKSKISVEAKIRNDEDGNEYVQLSKTQHICEPIEISNISFKHKETIVKECDFRLKADDEEIPENTLILFSNKEKTKFWNYRYRPSDKNYVCMECKYLKQYVMAKVLVNKLGEKFLRLGAYDHICEPKDYQP